MFVYELTHLVFQYADEFVYSPKKLGFFSSYESAKQAIAGCTALPGFRENPDTFSIRERAVTGDIANDIVFEVLVYIHSEDYEMEAEIELGLYGNEVSAQRSLNTYCDRNAELTNKQNLISEKIINRYVIGRRDWAEGFSISE